MHTYYQRRASEDAVRAAGNAEALERWAEAWRSAGWRTRVLTEADARSHPDYPKLRALFLKLPTVRFLVCWRQRPVGP